MAYPSVLENCEFYTFSQDLRLNTATQGPLHRWGRHQAVIYCRVHANSLFAHLTLSRSQSAWTWAPIPNATSMIPSILAFAAHDPTVQRSVPRNDVIMHKLTRVSDGRIYGRVHGGHEGSIPQSTSAVRRLLD